MYMKDTKLIMNGRPDEGGARARARQAPAGYEGQSAWNANYGQAADQALLALYSQRQQDRIDAENADRSRRMQQSGLWEPSVMNSPNMGGFFEGAQHNDAAAGIDPDTGEIVTGPKSVRMIAPAMSASRHSGIGSNRAYSLMALRALSRPQTDPWSIG